MATKRNEPKLAVAGSIDAGRRILAAVPLLNAQQAAGDIPQGLTFQRGTNGWVVRMRDDQTEATMMLVRGQKPKIDVVSHPAAAGETGDTVESSEEGTDEQDAATPAEQ